MSETIIIHRPGVQGTTRDADGNLVRTGPTDITIVAIAVAPLQGDESADQVAGSSVNGYTLYLPSGTDIRDSDRLTVRGVDGWQVEADAAKADWRSPFTDWKPGTVAVVRRSS